MQHLSENLLINRSFKYIHDIHFHLEKNGITVQKASSSEMIFSFEDIISYISKYITLKTGDLIFTGTPSGVGPVKIGDRLEAFIEGASWLQCQNKIFVMTNPLISFRRVGFGGEVEKMQQVFSLIFLLILPFTIPNQTTMELAPKYDPSIVEDKWYSFWMKNGFFHSEPDEREPYTIVIPPPNVTGVLHMGHMLNNTIQDILVRRARMQGKNAEWLPGTDHASIATEAKVVAKLKEQGIEKSSISREEFMKHAWEWKEKHGGIILEQLKKLGASCDWERTRFTMDKALYDSVISVFIDLYNKGFIYRGVRMVNWDPKALTALSDEEVIYKEVNSKLYYIRYKVEGTTDDWLTIATTRPETILGDTAICVHPEDERYSHLKGKKILVPLINRSIPVIFDTYVEREFGTGALKVTPAHDINDYNLGIKYNLPVIDTFNADGTMSDAAQLFIGEDRFIVRKKITQGT